MSDDVMIEGQQARANPQLLKIDPLANKWTMDDGAVLLLDKIKAYCEDPNIKLIVPFNKNLLEPACYKLRLGDDCRVDGVDKVLKESDPVLTIPPYGLAIVRTYEWLNLPGYLIARWNLKVKKVYRGLLWVGGPQVDPGYQGYLFCPLYNLSTEEVRLEHKEPLFVIDFVRTTHYDETKGCRLWEAKPARSTITIGSLDTDKIRSGVRAQLKRTERTVDTIKSETRAFQVGMMTAMSILFAVLAVIIAFQFVIKIDFAAVNLQMTPLALSAVAVGVSCFAIIIAIVSWFKRL